MLVRSRAEMKMQGVLARATLALYVFSEDAAAVRRVLGQLSFGGGCVNDTIMHLATHRLPFGGVGVQWIM